MKKSKDDNRRGPSPLVYRGVYGILQLFRIFLFRTKKGTRVELPEGPCLILANHSSFFDPLILISVTRQPFGFVVGDHLFRIRFVRWFLGTQFGSISCEKGGNHLKVLLNMSRKMRAGNKLCMFGEGNITYDGATDPVTLVTGKLAKTLKYPVVTVRISGSFMMRPRWSTFFHRGRVQVERMGVYTPEQLASMTEEEVTDLVNRDLCIREPASADSHEKAFFCKAKGIHLVLYACPVCGKLQTIREEGLMNIRCSACGAAGTWTRYGTIDSGDFPYHTLYEWNGWQRDYVRDMASGSGPIRITHPDVQLRHLWGNREREVETRGDLSITREEIGVGDLHFPLSSIETLDTRDKGILLFSTKDGDYYEVKGEKLYPGLLFKEMFLALRDESRKEREQGGQP